jgi:hypothetical protein
VSDLRRHVSGPRRSARQVEVFGRVAAVHRDAVTVPVGSQVGGNDVPFPRWLCARTNACNTQCLALLCVCVCVCVFVVCRVLVGVDRACSIECANAVCADDRSASRTRMSVIRSSYWAAACQRVGSRTGLQCACIIAAITQFLTTCTPSSLRCSARSSDKGSRHSLNCTCVARRAAAGLELVSLSKSGTKR